MRCIARGIALAVASLALASSAGADEPSPAVRVDGGLLVGMPVALSAGLSRGVSAGATRGDALAWGASASWSTATEYTTAFRVTHRDLRLHAIGELRHDAGRGSVALRLGAGGVLVHETRRREQGERAGLTGDALETAALRLVPSAELQVAAAVRVAGDWSAVVRGGPSVTWRDGRARGGWSGLLGVAWSP